MLVGDVLVKKKPAEIKKINTFGTAKDSAQGYFSWHCSSDYSQLFLFVQLTFVHWGFFLMVHVPYS